MLKYHTFEKNLVNHSLKIPFSYIFILPLGVLFLLLLVSTSSIAQIDIQPTDSIAEVRNQVKSKADSVSIATQQIFSDKKGAYSNTLTSNRNAFKNRTDSLDFATYKDSVINHYLNDLLSFSLPKPKLDSGASVDSIKSKFADFRSSASKYIKPTGEIVSESFATNYQDPFTLSEKSYSRWYGSPGLQLGMVPVRIDFYVSTEENTLYNSNSFSVSLDVDQLKNNVKQKAMHQVRELTSKKALLTQKKEQLAGIKSSLESDILAQKEQLKKPSLTKPSLSDLGADTSEFKNRMPTKNDGRLLLDNQVNKATDSLSQLKQMAISSGQDKLDSISDSIDSISSANYQKAQEKLDKLEKTYALIHSIYTVINTLDSAAETQISRVKEVSKNPSSVLTGNTNKLKKGRAAKMLASVEYLELGVSYPFFNRYSLNGTMVKGVNLGFASGKNRYAIVGGKTINNQINTFGLGQPAPEFNRNIQGLQFTHEFEKGSIQIANSSIWDGKSIQEPKINIVQTLHWNQQLTQKLVVDLTTAHSTYSTNYMLDQPEGSDNTFIQNRLAQSAFGLKSNYRLDGASKLKVDYKRIYSGFINLSNPFMRNGFHEYNGSLDRKLFKRRLKLSVSYKYFQDNIENNNATTNTMNGYGLAGRTSFKKLPNIFFQHAPYEQGNNHPDSLFRTNNQLSLTSVGLSYNKKGKKRDLSVLSSYTTSYIDFNKEGQDPISNRFLTVSVNVQSKTLSVALSGYRNQSLPKVDSLNYSGGRLELKQKAGKKMNAFLSSFFDVYDSDAYRINSNLGIEISALKKTTIRLSGGYGYIDGLFGIENKVIYSGALLMNYRF